MSRKGYEGLRPLGVLPVDGDPCWYFYYYLPEGSLLELEVSLDPDGVRFTKYVTSHVTDQDEVRDLLAS